MNEMESMLDALQHAVVDGGPRRELALRVQDIRAELQRYTLTPKEPSDDI